MNLIFFGSDLFALPSLRALVQSKHKILCVVTQPDKPAGRGQKISSCPAAVLTKNLKLPLLQPASLKSIETQKELLAPRPDVLVVVAYGKFLPQELVDATPKKAVNLHPSLLPKYRGAAPMQRAILNGDQKTGVTTAVVSDKMDAGDIFLQCETPLDEMETFAGLEQQLSTLGAELLLKTLDGIERGTLKPKPQNDSKATFAPKLTKEEGHLNFNESAEKLYNKVRALNPWPGTFCYFNQHRLKVLEAAPLDRPSQQNPGTVIENKEGLIVACGQKALCLLEIQLEGKKKMGAKEFLKGHSIPLGTQL